MPDTTPPILELMPDRLRAKPAHLVPLWTWLAVLTFAVSVYFLGCSQGWPLLPSFGLSDNASADKVRGQVAALFGIPPVAILFLLLLELTAEWMRRSHELIPVRSRWDALPAPDLWGLPSSDNVLRSARTVLWILLLAIPPYAMIHLTKIFPRASIYQECVNSNEQKLTGCAPFPEQKKPGEAPDSSPVNARVIATRDSWLDRMPVHLSFRTPEGQSYFSQKKYFRHGFRYGDAHGPSYYPGLQGWLYLILVCWSVVKWCCLLVAALRRRSPGKLWLNRAVYRIGAALHWFRTTRQSPPL